MRQDPAQTSELAQRWLDWVRVTQHHLLGAIERDGDSFDSVREALASHAEEMTEVREAIERVKAEGTHLYLDQKGKPHTRSHWSGMSTAEVAQQVGWRTRYDTLFREASRFIHPGMHGFSGFFRFEQPNRVILDARPTDDVDEVRGALSGAAICACFAGVGGDAAGRRSRCSAAELDEGRGASWSKPELMDAGTVRSVVIGGLITLAVSWGFYWRASVDLRREVRTLKEQSERLQELVTIVAGAMESRGLISVDRDRTGRITRVSANVNAPAAFGGSGATTPGSVSVNPQQEDAGGR